jgi:RNase P subunit RPR2
MAANKSTWFDEASSESLIADKAQRLESFLAAMADGKVTDAEVKEQEERVVQLMKEIEPQLDPKLHERVTQLLCELAAYDLMQSLNMLQSTRSAVKFRG